MPRELPGFRDQLEDILSFSNGNRILTKEEVQILWCLWAGATIGADFANLKEVNDK